MLDQPRQEYPLAINRRTFCAGTLAGLASCALPPVFSATSYAHACKRAAGELKVVDIKRTTVKVPYRPAPQ